MNKNANFRTLIRGLMFTAAVLLCAPAYAQQPKTTVLVGGMLINGLSVPPLTMPLSSFRAIGLCKLARRLR